MNIYELILESLKNPRGQNRPQDGSGKGKGKPWGRRLNKNKKPCSPDQPTPEKGKGRNRK